MKKILGLDLGTNSIGWALTQYDFDKKEGEILGMGSRIIPMDAKQLSNFSTGQTVTATADRTAARGMRRLYQRRKLRRERLLRVLNILDFLPDHYVKNIDFDKKVGQFKKDEEPKIAYQKDENEKHNFIFQVAFNEMVEDFKASGQDIQLPYDWTLYYLRKKALTKKIAKEELAWVLLSFNQKRGYYQSRDEEEKFDENKDKEYVELKVIELRDSGQEIKGNKLYDVYFDNGWKYSKQIVKTEDWKDKTREFIVTSKKLKDGSIKRTFKKVEPDDWIAIKNKTEDKITNSKEELGEYIYNNLLSEPFQKIRGKLVKTIDRKFYKEELTKILETQVEHHPELTDKKKFEKCINELYKHNEAHKRNLLNIGNNTKEAFSFFLIEDILFYQRPLKSKKSTISSCPFESRTYKKDGDEIVQPLKCISKSHPLYQEFRLWQFIHNIRIYKREATVKEKPVIDHDVTIDFLNEETDYVSLYDFLNECKEIKQSTLLKHFGLKEEDYRWNYVEDKSYPCNELRYEIVNRLSKIEGLNIQELTTDEFIFNLWHLIYSVTDRKQYSTALKTFANKHNINEDDFHNAFIKMKPFDSSYGAFSEKAIKKLLPLMRRGKYWDESVITEEVKQRINSIIERLEAINYDTDKIETVIDDDVPKQVFKSFLKTLPNPLKGLNTYQASYAVYGRHAELSEITRWIKPKHITKYLNDFKQHSLRNPVVEQLITETLRVVHDIWADYGKGEENFFQEIHVELGRDMKNDKKTRGQLTKIINENTNTNERIKNILQELMNDINVEGNVRPHSKGHQEILKLYEEGVYTQAKENYKNISIDEINTIRSKVSPSKSEINKYKLWMEQGYISPYTGEIIPLSKLFTTDYEVEHIIPRSRFFDDSMSNKVICESEINPYPYKGNKTAYQFIKDRGGSIVPELSKNGKQVSILSLEDYESHCKTYFKSNKKKLELLLSEEVPEDFINRQLNDSRYISKVVKGLLSNVVREENEQDATSKNLVPVAGRITSKLKKDWGLNNVWDELLTPRFERMNEITDSKGFRFENTDVFGNKYIINTVPDELSKGFTKKRLDHRHHPLDALVIACATKDHINYITSLNTKRKNHSLVRKLRKVENKEVIDKLNGGTREITIAKDYHKPWSDFTQDAKKALENIIVSFKQNKRVINRATNNYFRWKKVNGQIKKVKDKQKGQNWAIRKSLHKATYYGKIDGIKTPKGKIATAGRVSLSGITSMKKLESITDTGIQKILKNHLKNYIDKKGNYQFDLAFNPDGIDHLNKKIQQLNSGKPHQPIKKVRVYEIGSKFPLGDRGNNDTKFVEADKGTNLFFNIYWDENKKKRNYETVPLNEVIAHQKMVANLPKKERTETPTNPKLGKFIFSLSPEDLVYVPTDEEINNPNLVDFNNLSRNTVDRIYKMEKSSGKECYFIKHNIADLVKKYDVKTKYGELGSQNKLITTMFYDNIKIADKCWKIKVNRIGNIQKVIR